MSFFSNKLAAAESRNTALVALFAALGVTIKADGELPTPAALSAELDTQKKSAGTAAVGDLLKSAGLVVVGDATPAATLTAALGAKDSLIALHRDGLTAAGVKLGDFITAEALTAEEKKDKSAEQIAALVREKNVALIKDAIATKASALSATQISNAGHGSALDLDISKNGGEPETAAQLQAALNAEKDDEKRWTIFKKLQALEAKAAQPGKN